MKKVLFATTNSNKISRLKNFLKDEEVEILSLSDLDYQINEPEEIGNTPVEIAVNKAKHYWDNLKLKMPVIAQDDTIEFFDVPELSTPRLSIKKPVTEKYSEFNDDNAIKFYTELAKKYGGKISMRFNYGFGLCDVNTTVGKDATLSCVLVNEVSKTVNPGYFLTAIIKLIVDNEDVFYSEMTSEQQAIADNDLANAVKFLLSKLN